MRWLMVAESSIENIVAVVLVIKSNQFEKLPLPQLGDENLTKSKDNIRVFNGIHDRGGMWSILAKTYKTKIA